MLEEVTSQIATVQRILNPRIMTNKPEISISYKQWSNCDESEVSIKMKPLPSMPKTEIKTKQSLAFIPYFGIEEKTEEIDFGRSRCTPIQDHQVNGPDLYQLPWRLEQTRSVCQI